MPARKSYLLLLLLSASSVAVAQEGRVEFDEVRHEFGVIEEGVEASHTFRFRNTGTAPVTLVDVRPSCGCTTPSWTRGAIAPGDSGTVTAVYHSEDRPGPFDKGITIHTDGQPQVLQLRISGDVSPIALAGTRLGSLVVEGDFVTFDRIRVGPPAVTSMRIQNAGDRALRIDSVQTSAGVLFTDYAGRTLQPGQSDEVTLILDTDALQAGEDVAFDVTLLTDDPTDPQKVVSVRGSVE